MITIGRRSGIAFDPCAFGLGERDSIPLEGPYVLVFWTDNLSVGIKAFDDDHKQVLRIINELHHEILAGKIKGGIPFEEIEIQLHRLENYIDYHCAHEEKVLNLTKYPKLELHKSEHAILKARLVDMSLRFKGSTSPADAEEIMNTAYEWIHEHIFTVDIDYAEHLRGRDDLFPDGPSPAHRNWRRRRSR